MSVGADISAAGRPVDIKFDPTRSHEDNPHKALFIARMVVRTKLASQIGGSYPALVAQGYDALGYVCSGHGETLEEAVGGMQSEYEALTHSPKARFLGSSETPGSTAPKPRERTRTSAPAPAPQTSKLAPRKLAPAAFPRVRTRS